MNPKNDSTIFGIMRDEYHRLVEVERAYLRTIKDLPHGSPRLKKIRNGEYLYLAHREGAKVVYDYIGPTCSEKAQHVIAQIEKRGRLAALLKETRRALKDVRRVLRGKI